MNQAAVGDFLRKPRILVAPLDWGLGHATRCIPIIRELLDQGAEPWLAAAGPQQQLLQAEFPQLPMLEIPGYNIRYGRSALGLLFNMFIQTPRIFRSIKKEHAWLEDLQKDNSFDAVISDNRYGLYNNTIPTVFITHQLAIKSPMGKWTEKFLQKSNYKYIKRFTQCWVPDNENRNELAGELSHPGTKPDKPLQYIGPLTRLEKINVEEEKDHLLVLLSGPEPQRTILENKIIKEIVHYNGTATIVRGIPDSKKLIPSTNQLLFYNHLDAKAISKEMARASYVISRSGYSTVMDVMALNKKSILIPTPGQTEQEYLSKHLMEKGHAYCVIQKEFNLTTALNAANNFQYKFPQISDSKLSQAVAGLLKLVVIKEEEII